MLKKLFFRLAAVSLGFFMVFLLIEAGLRLWAPSWLETRMKSFNFENDLRSFGTDLHWPVEEKDGFYLKFIPGSRFRVNHYEFDHEVHINAWGGRRTPFCQEGNESFVIPFLGDSFTFGIGVRDDETFVNLLSAEMKKCFLNLGMSGAALDYQIQLIKRRHDELGNPRLYVFNLFMGNDLSPSVNEKQEKPRIENLELLTKKEHRSWDNFILTVNYFFYHVDFLPKSYALQYIRAKLIALINQARMRKGSAVFADSIYGVMERSQEPSLREWIHGKIASLARLAEEKGFEVFILMIPDGHQVSDGLFRERARYYGIPVDQYDRELPNRVLADELEKAGIPYLDLLPCMRQYERAELLKSQGENLYYLQDNHLTPLGHRVVADCAIGPLRKWYEEKGV
ncbi:MAG: SGNH/GDSL hydrolase family protein [Candidatus Omnitrophica bacterium]|nr:SGNH/GDSL hydrolase family protein [Candidatus Omnitrophota bacterium]